MAKVSVVIGTYNRRDKLERAIHSILKQEGGPWDLEVLVVGDGTDLETEMLMSAWVSGDSRLRFENRPRQEYPKDKGQMWCVLGLEARNWGHEHATGDYLAELDDDDEWEPHFLATMVPELERLKVDLVYGRSLAYDQQGKVVAHYGKWPPMHFSFCNGAWLMKREKDMLYDPECIKRGLPEDGDRIDRMVAAGVKMAFVDKVVHRYHVNPR